MFLIPRHRVRYPLRIKQEYGIHLLIFKLPFYGLNLKFAGETRCPHYFHGRINPCCKKHLLLPMSKSFLESLMPLNESHRSQFVLCSSLTVIKLVLAHYSRLKYSFHQPFYAEYLPTHIQSHLTWDIECDNLRMPLARLSCRGSSNQTSSLEWTLKHTCHW